MIESVRIQNLRSLNDTGFINLKKINILLGANSSGKSTFLRSFPLFTQSLHKNLQGPISWFDNAYVDFGDYQTAKNRYAPKEETITFSYSLRKPRALFRYMYQLLTDIGPISTESIDEVKLSVSYANDSIGTYVNKIVISLADIDFKYLIENRNGLVKYFVKNIERPFPRCKWDQSTRTTTLPTFILDQTEKDNVKKIDAYLIKAAVECARKSCDGHLKHLSKLNSVFTEWIYDENEYLYRLRNITAVPSLRKKANVWSVDSEIFLELYNKSADIYIYSLLCVISSEITAFYNNSSYIAPLRAEANRYYRSQGLQVNEIDSNGKNLDEFIRSLTDRQKASYNEFCLNTLGVKVETQYKNGHNCIILKNKDGYDDNLIDVGFGYSQVLPILTKVWHAGQVNRKTYNNFYYRYFDTDDSLILIEQPELHLHPAMQAKVADTLVGLIAKVEEEKEKHENPSEAPVRIVIETHSQAIVNRIGRRIREKKITNEDVNVVLFSQKKDSKDTEVLQIHFDENGKLLNWPYGFFDPNED